MPRRFHLERPNGNRWRKRVFLSRGCGTPPNTSGQGHQHPNFGTSYMTPIRYYTQQTNSARWSNYMRVKFYQVDYAFDRDQMFLMCACISRPTGWRVIIICTCFYCSRSSREAHDVIRSSIMHENNALSHWPIRRKNRTDKSAAWQRVLSAISRADNSALPAAVFFSEHVHSFKNENLSAKFVSDFIADKSANWCE